MKFTDKFVLVPIERYERLKNSQIEEPLQKDKETKVKNTQNGGQIKEEKDQTEEEIISEVVSPETNSFQIKDNTKSVVEPKQENSFKNFKKEKTKRKLPRPPPGIPARIKEIDFHWVNLKRTKRIKL